MNAINRLQRLKEEWIRFYLEVTNQEYNGRQKQFQEQINKAENMNLKFI